MIEKKCKACGGNLVLVEGKTVYECEYCGAKQIIPLSKEETEAEEKAKALEEEKKRLEKQKAEEKRRRLENEKLEAEQKRIEEQKRAEREKRRIDEQKAEESRLRLEEEQEKARLEEKKRHIEQERLEEEKRRIEEQKREEERRRQKVESIGKDVITEKKNKKMLLKIVLILFVLCVVGAICAIAIDAQEKTKIAEKQRIEAEKQAKIKEKLRHNCESIDRLFPCQENSTGFFWSSRSTYKMDSIEAKKYCESLSEGAFYDWKLPSISVLRTTIQNCSSSQTGGSCKISDNCLTFNCVSQSCFCKNENNIYSKLGDDARISLWSSSARSDYPDNVWLVDFKHAAITFGHKNNKEFVRCVRSPY